MELNDFKCKICGEEKSSRRLLFIHTKCKHNMPKREYMEKYYSIPKCACGCGEYVEWGYKKWWNKYVNGHNQQNKEHRDSTKRKIAKALIGNKSRSGQKRSESEKRRTSFAQSGEKNHQWQGGISFEPYGTDFNDRLKEQVRERDNWTCRECSYTEVQLNYKLNVHHIDYDKTSNNTDNLISLCKSCHMQTNFKRDDWTAYFRSKLQGTEFQAQQLLLPFME